MRTFAIVLGCLAWVLSCYDAVSYYRAGGQQHRAEARLPAAAADQVAEESFAGQDGRRMQKRVETGEAAVAGDQLALDRAQQSGAGEAQARQALAADQAALQADRMMQYTVEDFARKDPNPAAIAAENRVGVDHLLLAKATATRARDKSLAHGLIALWGIVAGTGVLAWRRSRTDDPWLDSDEDDDEERQPFMAEDRDA